ncbi:MAG: NAD(P)H-binding protein, partial [Alphaproteobacteria bacterium]|nr:NAD(P)H-binding protein [Alphaproteobacteria bacterium]
MVRSQQSGAHNAPDDTKPALVLGGTGSFGGAVARELVSRGRSVRLLVRSPGRAKQIFAGCSSIEIVAGDVQEISQLQSAAQGCSLIVHGVNYPYDCWVPYMHTATLNVISAARDVGADVLFPGNVYGYGAQGPAPLSEGAAVKPNSRKGRFRIRLEQTLAEATRVSAEGDDTKPKPIRVLVVRGGDYFGPTVRNELADWV